MWRQKMCGQSGCPNAAMQTSRWCTAHQQTNEQKERERLRQQDEVNRLYGREPWTSFRIMLLNRNPFCQRIHNGKRCENLATLVHHLLSPRERPDLFTTPANCVGLCEHCHPNDAGTPQWRPHVDYIPTVFDPPNFE